MTTWTDGQTCGPTTTSRLLNSGWDSQNMTSPSLGLISQGSSPRQHETVKPRCGRKDFNWWLGRGFTAVFKAVGQRPLFLPRLALEAAQCPRHLTERRLNTWGGFQMNITWVAWSPCDPVHPAKWAFEIQFKRSRSIDWTARCGRWHSKWDPLPFWAGVRLRGKLQCQIKGYLHQTLFPGLEGK